MLVRIHLLPKIVIAPSNIAAKNEYGNTRKVLRLHTKQKSRIHQIQYSCLSQVAKAVYDTGQHRDTSLREEVEKPLTLPTVQINFTSQ